MLSYKYLKRLIHTFIIIYINFEYIINSLNIFFKKKYKNIFKKLKKTTSVYYNVRILPDFKQLLHIKYFNNIREFTYYDSLKYHYYKIPKKKKYKLNVDSNRINFFFKISDSMAQLRVLVLSQLHVGFFRKTQMNMFFASLKNLTVMEFMWMMEWGVMLFLIRMRVTGSFHQSVSYLNNSLLFLKNSYNVHKWDYLFIADPSGLLINKLIMTSLKYNLFKFFYFWALYRQFNKYIRKIHNNTLDDSLKKINFEQILPNKITWTYFQKVKMTKYMESDYRIMLFILLSLSNWKLYYSDIYLNWLNYWNHGIFNWKSII